MKKKILFMFGVAAFAGALAFNSLTNSKQATVSTVTLSNIEALTRKEDPQKPCIESGSGCFDSGWNPYFKESQW